MASRRMDVGYCDPEWCPIEVSIEVIGGTWKVIIVRELLGGTKRYSQLHRALKRVTHKMLAQQLRELERDGVVTRKVYPQVPPKVEYSLTPLGDDLGPMLDTMQKWGARVLATRATPPTTAPAQRRRLPATPSAPSMPSAVSVNSRPRRSARSVA
jgi:DNA-binding HxlR family transcriptional regulator